jgi:hypothetical protein
MFHIQVVMDYLDYCAWQVGFAGNVQSKFEPAKFFDPFGKSSRSIPVLFLLGVDAHTAYSCRATPAD